MEKGVKNGIASEKFLELHEKMYNIDNWKIILGKGVSFLGTGVSASINLGKFLVENLLKAISILNTNPLMHYIAFAIAILVVIAVVFGVAFNKNNSKSNYVQAPTFLSKYNLMNYVNFTPSYKMKLFTYDVSPYGKTTDISETDRPLITGGRCDNLNTVVLGDTNVCLKTTIPEPIIWTIDVDKMPDFRDNLSTETKRLLDGGGKHYTIVIPWKIYEDDGVHYYPSCTDAYFQEDSTVSAAYLFTRDVFNSCERATVTRKMDFTEKKRLVNGQSIDTYL
jgi:hypothetical protein